MKMMILAVFAALAVTAGVASAGVASLADAANILISATSHSGTYDSTANSVGVSAVVPLSRS
jgi:hypothetical protein